MKSEYNLKDIRIAIRNWPHLIDEYVQLQSNKEFDTKLIDYVVDRYYAHYSYDTYL